MKRFYSPFVKPGDLVFNIGANMGTRTAVFLDLGSRVIAVEPQEALCERLKQLFQGRDVVVHCAAAGPEMGEADLYLYNDSQVATCVPDRQDAVKVYWPDWPIEPQHKSVRVPQITLDWLIGEYGRPAFIKIDVEGYEDRVLAALSDPVAAISFEYTILYPKPALRAVERATELGFTAFNYTNQEQMKFESRPWLSGSEMIKTLERLPASAFYGDIFAVQEGLMAEETEKKQEKRPKEPSVKEPTGLKLEEDMIVAAPGKGIWGIEDGKRRWVPNPRTQVLMGIGSDIIVHLTPEQLESIPEGESYPELRPKGRLWER